MIFVLILKLSLRVGRQTHIERIWIQDKTIYSKHFIAAFNISARDRRKEAFLCINIMHFIRVQPTAVRW